MENDEAVLIKINYVESVRIYFLMPDLTHNTGLAQ
jgi:hypothetical protein